MLRSATNKTFDIYFSPFVVKSVLPTILSLLVEKFAFAINHNYYHTYQKYKKVYMWITINQIGIFVISFFDAFNGYGN